MNSSNDRVVNNQETSNNNAIVHKIIRNATNIFKQLLQTNQSSNQRSIPSEIDFKLEINIVEYNNGNIEYKVGINQKNTNLNQIRTISIAPTF